MLHHKHFFRLSQHLAMCAIIVTLSQMLVLLSLRISPEVSAATTQTATVNTNADLLITDSQANQNQYFRRHGGAGVQDYNGNFGVGKTLFKFDGLNDPFYKNVVVTSAYLEVRQFSTVYTNGLSWNSEVGTINQNWSDTNATWNNMASHVGGTGSTVNFAYGVNVTRQLNVTSQVQQMIAGNNFGLALFSNQTSQGGFLCSIRNRDNYPGATGGDNANCDGFTTHVIVNYVQNDKPNTPQLIGNTLNSGQKIGGEPYINNNGWAGGRSSGQNCEKNNGCGLELKFGNIGDPNDGQTNGFLTNTRIELIPMVGGQYQNQDFGGTKPNISWSPFVKDGKYIIRSRSNDNLGLASDVVDYEITIDTTAPEPLSLKPLPEFSKGNQRQIEANAVNDTLSISNPVKYDFCRSDDMNFTTGVYCSSNQDPVNNPQGLWQDSGYFIFGNLENDKTYFYRSRAKDTVNLANPNQANSGEWSPVVSSIQDSVAPVISNPELVESTANPKTKLRISPKDQDGKNDVATVSFGITEKHFNSAKIQLYKVTPNSETLSAQNLVLEQTINPTTIENLNYITYDILNGKDKDGNWLADGSYIVRLVATDKAGNEADNTDLVLTIDNEPGAVNISTPPNNAFVNVNTIDISGQVVSQDATTLEECKLVDVSCVLHKLDFQKVEGESSFFTKNYNLKLGKNTIRFKSTDTVGNVQQKEVVITREEEKPTISAQIDELNWTTEIKTKNRKPVLKFVMADPNIAGHGQSGIDKNAVNLSLISSKGDELKLITNGQNVGAIGRFTTTCDDNVVLVGYFVTGKNDCVLNYTFSGEIQPDDTYKVKLSVADKAHNDGAFEQLINLDSTTYLDIAKPADNQVFARKVVHFEGKAEVGSVFKITSNSGQSVLVKLKVSSNDTFGNDENNQIISGVTDTSYVQSKFTIRCDQAFDYDNSLNTGNDGKNKICSFGVDLIQGSSDTNTTTTTQNIFQITDDINNTISKTITTQVNLFAVNLGVVPDLSFISADGNGKQDGINFTLSATNPNNTSDDVLVDTWTLVITKDGEVNPTRTITGSGSLPTSLNFDGKDSNGKWLSDGSYAWSFKLKTKDNPNLPAVIGSFQNVTKSTAGVFITTPNGTQAKPFITTKGALNVQGQAKMSDPTLNFKDYQVSICIDNADLVGECDYEQKVEVDNDGFFSAVLPLFRQNPISNDIIQAKIIDKFGNLGAVSNKVYVRQNTVDPFVNVAVIPTYSGINSTDVTAQLSKLTDEYQGETNPTKKAQLADKIKEQVTKMRAIIFRSTVTQDTQLVKLKYNDLTSTKELTGNEASKYIGWIDGSNFDYTKNGLDTVPTDGKPCASSRCVWDFTYPVPNLGGGLYTVDFTGKKGETEQTMQAPFYIDANILSKPIIFDVKKVIGGTITNAKYYQDKYHTNSKTVEIRGVADPDTQVTIVDSKTGNTICVAQTSSINVFSCKVDLPVGVVEQDLSLTVTASKIGKTATSEKDTGIRFDPIAPTITKFQNINDDHSQFVHDYLCEQNKLQNSQCLAEDGLSEGFYRQSGDTVQTSISSNEALAYSFIQNQVEKAKYAQTLENNDISSKGEFQIEGYTPEGLYKVTVEIQDIAGNATDQTITYQIDNTNPDQPTQDKTNWGKYTGFDRRGFTPDLDKMVPADDRQLQILNQANYVVKSDSIVFQGVAELESYPVLMVNNVDVASTKLDETQCYQKSEDKLTSDNVVVKSGIQCLFKIEIKFQDLYDALKKANAIPTNNPNNPQQAYLIQWRAEDKSGNTTERTQQYLLAYDTLPPQFFTVNKASSGKSNPLIDWKTNGAETFYNDGRGNLPAVTNQTDLNIQAITEGLSDVEYILLNPQGQQIDYQRFINSAFQSHEKNFKLGDKKADTDGQIGYTQDGMYQLCRRSADSADNERPLECFRIERDTLTPSKPTFQANLNFTYKQLPYTIGGATKGEPYTNSKQLGNLGKTGFKSGTLKTLDPGNDSDWERTFTFCDNLTDRATNQSGSVCKSVTTPVRPPRDGECELSEGQREKVKNYIVSGDQSGNLTDDLNFSKSCKTYEAQAIQDAVNKSLNEVSESRKKAFDCVEQNEQNNLKAQTNFVGPLPAKQKCDTNFITQDELQNIKDQYQQALDDYNNQVAKSKEDQQKAQEEVSKQAEANKCTQSWNIFDSNNCFTKGVVAGATSIVTGIVDLGKSIYDVFASGNWQAGLTKLVIVAAVIAVSILIGWALGPILLGAGTALAGVLGLAGIAGATATAIATAIVTIAAGAVVGATINTGAAAIPAIKVNFDPNDPTKTTIDFNQDAFKENLAQNFCGTNSKDANPATCAGYFAGQTLTGEVLAFVAAAGLRKISNVTKIALGLDDSIKLNNGIKNTTNILDDVEGGVKNTTKSPKVDEGNTTSKPSDDTTTKPQTDDNGKPCPVAVGSVNPLVAFVSGVRVEAACNTVPSYIQDKRYPVDAETVLVNKEFTKTGKQYSSGANIYKDADGNYYYIDRNHKGLASEIEMFDKKGNHLGTMKPDGTLNPDSRVSGRTLPKNYR